MRSVRHTSILIGAVAGAALGGLAHLLFAGEPALDAAVKYVSRPVGQVFLRLLFMLVIPLIVSALAAGVAGLGDLKHLGRIGVRTLVLTAGISAIAVVLGIGLVNLLHPGSGMTPELRERLTEGAAERASVITKVEAPKTGLDLLIQIVPDNPIRAAASGDMLAVIFFALMLGIGLLLTPEPEGRSLLAFLDSLFQVAMRLIELVLRLAPVGVAALLFTLTAELGYEILGYLAKYVAVVVAALAIHQFGVYSLALKLAGKSPLAFFREVQPAMLTAFATASSNATLPTALKVAEENLKLPAHVSRFVLTVGATGNQNGTALFEGVTVLFLAQFYGVELSLAQQFLVVMIAILGGIGTAGVPAGSIPVVAVILGMVNVPVEGIGLILGVDRFLDMCRTTLNVTGDLALATLVAKGEPAEAAVPGALEAGPGEG